MGFRITVCKRAGRSVVLFLWSWSTFRVEMHSSLPFAGSRWIRASCLVSCRHRQENIHTCFYQNFSLKLNLCGVLALFWIFCTKASLLFVGSQKQTQPNPSNHKHKARYSSYSCSPGLCAFAIISCSVQICNRGFLQFPYKNLAFKVYI